MSVAEPPSPAELLDKREVRIADVRAIAPSYDLLNHLLSLQHRPLLALADDAPGAARRPRPDPRSLHRHRRPGPGLRQGRTAAAPIVGADFCHPMLVRGVAKAAAKRLRSTSGFIEADAQRLPFPDDTFQLTTVAFGLRNVTDTDRGMAEMVRVTRPGGRVAILEFSRPHGLVVRPALSLLFSLDSAGGRAADLAQQG